MFGLMKAKKCGMSVDEKNFRRLNYCGTCKTIGSLYGQKSRLLLNYDTVFLAELLTAVTGEDIKDWQNAYQSYNCLSLPKNKMPLALKFAATTNIILTQFKLADHISDENKKRHRFAQYAFSSEFQIAEQLLDSWSFPLKQITKILSEQEVREAVESNKDLNYFAAPTAQATAIFFAEGVKFIGRNDLEKIAYEIGFEFGRMVYLLDAFEDYEKDAQAKQFNAIRKSFRLKKDKIDSQTKRKLIAYFEELESEIIEKIYALPINQSKKQIFSNRLSDNLKRKLKTKLPLIKTAKVCRTKAETPVKNRWKHSFATAKTFARDYSWQMPFVFLFILMFAIIAPAQTREVKSARECWDLSFNLMFLGAMFGSIMALAKPVFTNQDSDRLYPDIEPQKKKKEQDTHGEEESWCDYCTDCDCDGCDGCCCECDGCCCCDSCDCSCD